MSRTCSGRSRRCAKTAACAARNSGPRQHIFAVRRDLMDETTYKTLLAVAAGGAAYAQRHHLRSDRAGRGGGLAGARRACCRPDCRRCARFRRRTDDACICLARRGRCQRRRHRPQPMERLWRLRRRRPRTMSCAWPAGAPRRSPGSTSSPTPRSASTPRPKGLPSPGAATAATTS